MGYHTIEDFERIEDTEELAMLLSDYLAMFSTDDITVREMHRLVQHLRKQNPLQSDTQRELDTVMEGICWTCENIFDL